MGGSSDRRNGEAKRYCWPSSKLGEEEMKLLYDEKVRTGKPITWLIREAIVARYSTDVNPPCRTKTER